MKVLRTEISIEEINTEIKITFFDPMVERQFIATFIKYEPIEKIMVFIHPLRNDKELDEEVEINISSINERLKEHKINQLYMEQDLLKQFYNKNKESLLRYFMNECPSTRIRFMQLLRG